MRVGVWVREGVNVGVMVRVAVGVRVMLGVNVFVGVRVIVGVGVREGVKVIVGVRVMVGVSVGGVGPWKTKRTASTPVARLAPTAPLLWCRTRVDWASTLMPAVQIAEGTISVNVLLPT